MLPFVRTSRVRYYHPEAEIGTYDDAIRTIIENAGVDSAERNILIAHQFVTGRKAPKLSGSESSSVQNVGTVDMIRYDNFRDFDYVALGHIHSPQEVGRETVRYSGSPLKYSLREAEDDKYVTIVELADKGDVRTEQIRLVPRRDLRHLRGKLKDILAPENVSDTQDYIYVTLTDEDYIDNVEGIIRQIYPNFTGLDYDNAHTPSGDMGELSDRPDEKTFDELISDFYLAMYGTEMNEEELAAMKAAARKAGVIDEAD
jgi:exonuclease SbcD